MKDYFKDWFLICVLLTCAFLGRIAVAAPHYTDYSHCYDFSTFRKPERMSLELLEEICHYAELHGLTIIVHSTWRPKDELITDEPFFTKSLHPEGEAIDFRFKRPNGVSESAWYRRTVLGLWTHLVERGLACWGMGIYFDTRNRFVHIDTGKGVACNRRWSRIAGKYLTFGDGINQMIKEVRVY